MEQKATHMVLESLGQVGTEFCTIFSTFLRHQTRLPVASLPFSSTPKLALGQTLYANLSPRLGLSHKGCMASFLSDECSTHLPCETPSCILRIGKSCVLAPNAPCLRQMVQTDKI